jgi:outer membrane receptor protein involved in Fe transport
MNPAYMKSLGLEPIGRYASLDPTDGGRAEQVHLSAEFHADAGPGHFDGNAFFVYNRMELWNDFTHFLNDPTNGDQEAQNDNRRTLGGRASYDLPAKLFGLDNDYLVGVWTRYDNNNVDRDFTVAHKVTGQLEGDVVNLQSYAAYAQAITHWTDWMRTVLGVREDYQTGTDAGTDHGDASATIFQPKGSVIVSPWEGTEFYVSAGRGFHSDDIRGVTQAKLLGVAGAPLLAKSTGEEVGVRSTVAPNLTATLTVFNIDFQSETTYDPDAGVDSAGPPSRRYGVELNTTYQPFEWLEFYTSLAGSHARYTEAFDDGTGRIGKFIPNAPIVIGSIAAYVRNLGPWTGGLELRYLGAYPLTPDNSERADGYLEVNANGSYAFGEGWQFGAGIYNLLNTHADAAEFWYADRLPGEPAAGVPDVHVHPLEPISVRFTLSKLFD